MKVRRKLIDKILRESDIHFGSIGEKRIKKEAIANVKNKTNMEFIIFVENLVKRCPENEKATVYKEIEVDLI